MKLGTIILAATVSSFSTYAHASSDFQCYFSKENQSPIALINIEELPASGNLIVTQEDAYYFTPGYNEYKFSAKVENSSVVGDIVISSMKIENTKLGVATEHTDLTIGQVKTVNLTISGDTFTFQCFLN